MLNPHFFLPRIFGALLLSIPVLFSGTHAYGSLPTEEILMQYREIHRGLSKDDLNAARASSQNLVPLLQQWLAEGEAESQAVDIKGMLTSAQVFTTLTEDQAVRIEFGNLSKSLVAFVRKSTDLKGRLQLFFCPMFPQGYAYWAQTKGEALNNPYWGSKMLTCGVKKTW